MNKVELGRQGEELAAQALRANGYRILERNVRSRMGEIDLVAQDGRTLCFVEIRAKKSLRFGWPEESVGRLKKMRLVRLAQWYLQRYRLSGVPIRFDVVSIFFGSDATAARTRLIKGAFDASS